MRTLVTAMLVQMDSRASLNDILEEVMEAEPAGPVLGLHDLSREIRYKKRRAQRFNDEFDVNPIVAEHAREVLDTAVNGGENAHGGLVGALAALEASEHLINHHLSKYVDTQEELVDLKTLCKSLLYVRRTVMDGEDRRDYIGAMLGVFANPNIDDAHSLLELVLETYPEALTPSNIRDIDVTETERQQIILDLAYAERVRKERTLRKLIALDNLDESQFAAIEKLKSYQEDPQSGKKEILEEFGDSLLFVQTTRAKSDSDSAYTAVLRDNDSAPDQVSYVVVKTGEEDVVVRTSYDEELRHHGGGHFGTAANFMLRILREDIIPMRRLTLNEKLLIEKTQV